jgi:phosphate transport system permease protein
MTTTGQAAVISLYGKASQDLSYDSAFLLLLFVLLIIILGRVIISISRRDAE